MEECLTELQIKKDKLKFIEMLENTKHAPEELFIYLQDDTDFYFAPASTKYHEAYKGGLCLHSLKVAHYMKPVIKNYEIKHRALTDEQFNSCLFCALLHDLCKANFYTVQMRNVKNQNTGRWEQKPFYAIDDQWPMGHGEKSVMILSRFIELSDEEAAAINWHMGFSDIRCKDFAGMNALSSAMEKYPMVLMLHAADMMATYWGNMKSEKEEKCSIENAVPF